MDSTSDMLHFGKFIDTNNLFTEKNRVFGTLNFVKNYLLYKPNGMVASLLNMYPSKKDVKVDAKELMDITQMFEFVTPTGGIVTSTKVYEMFLKNHTYAKCDAKYTDTDIIAALCITDTSTWAGKTMKKRYGKNYKSIRAELKREVLDKSLATIPQREFEEICEEFYPCYCEQDYEQNEIIEPVIVPAPITKKEKLNVTLTQPTKEKLPSSLTDLGELMAKKNPILIGREDIIEEMIEVMQMYNLPNPILVGNAGSGKTAIVEYLAYLMNQGKIDKKLNGKEILRMDLQSQMSNTTYVGELEKKIRELVNAVKKRDSWVFIDETHAIVGAGATDKNNNDIANMLKPYLQDGTIRLIGSTTPKEYKIIEHESAFNRRLERIDVPPLTKLQTIDVINGLRPRREQFYGVEMKPDYAVQIADKCETIVGHSPAREIKVLDRAFVKAARLGSSTIDSSHIEYALKKQIQSKTMGF